MLADSDLLWADNVTVRYGGVVANEEISISTRAGEIVGLIGPNGAGKTTFIDALTGFTEASGSIWLEGARIDRLRAYARRKAGLARTWQAGELFADLTVAANLAVAADGFGLRVMLRDLWRFGSKADDAEVARLLDAVGLSPDVAHRLPTELSLADQKLVGVARALAGGSRVLLLDEPAAGLDTEHTARLGSQLKQLAQIGLSVLLVDHDMSFVLNLCDRIYVLDFGRLIASGTPSEIAQNAAVIDAYLGEAEGED